MPQSCQIDATSPALLYHQGSQQQGQRPGKCGLALTKPLSGAKDLELAYTPGVAQPVLAIAKNPQNSYRYTNKGNRVAVISNGSAVLGLGDVGALASKPVMEGKAVLFKHFADIDAVDIEIDCQDPKELIETICRIAPSFGGINLEDIKAPDCFIIEKALREKLDIPVMHDDQHGTAVTLAAGLINALEIQAKSLSSVNITCLGGGAAAIACMHLLIELGANRNAITLVDRRGVIYEGREHVNEHKAFFAKQTQARTLDDAMNNADVFIGLSGPNTLNTDQLKLMNDKPVIFALSNPTPEIDPQLVKTHRPDALMATGRSDHPNQINNLLCFPYIFRAVLDAGIKQFTPEIFASCVHAIAQLAHEPVDDDLKAYYPKGTVFTFGPDYFIPKAFDRRLRAKICEAVSL